MTKLITAVCLLQLVERGLMGLDEDAGAYVPQLKEMQIVTDSSDEAGNPSMKENKSPITLRCLFHNDIPRPVCESVGYMLRV